MRRALDGVADAEAVEHVKNIRAKLDAVADGAEFLRLLEHRDGNSLAAERERCRKSAKPAADNQDRDSSLCPPISPFFHRSAEPAGESPTRDADPLDFPVEVDAGRFP